MPDLDERQRLPSIAEDVMSGTQRRDSSSTLLGLPRPYGVGLPGELAGWATGNSVHLFKNQLAYRQPLRKDD